jgi:hypothetical protein
MGRNPDATSYADWGEIRDGDFRLKGVVSIG